MLLEARNILDLPIASIEEKEKIGIVKKIIVNKVDASILGFLISSGNFLFGKNYFVSADCVLDIDAHGLTIRNKESLTEPREIYRVKKILEERFEILGLSAVAKSKERLGKISNFVVDTRDIKIVKYYISGWLENKIIDHNKVYKITSREIIFKDFIERKTSKEKIGKLVTN